MVRYLGVFLSLLLTSQVAHSRGLELGEPTYGGTGCPMGTAAVALSPDNSQLSILFDQYVVEAGGAKTIDRKNCNIAIPIHVPQGYSVSVMKIDYRGFLALPSGARAQLSVNYFLPGSGRGVNSTKTFYGPSTSDYLKQDNLGLEAIVWSACGADTILRANTSLHAQTNSRREQALATVDSADVSSGLIYHLQWRQCR